MNWELIDNSVWFTSNHNDYTNIIDFDSYIDKRDNVDTYGGFKIAGFDMDNTLIKTKSGKIFPNDENDWIWMDDSIPKKLETFNGDVSGNNQYGKHFIIIFSNQKHSDLNRIEKVKLKIHLINENIKKSNYTVPFMIFLATKDDKYRKPCIEMWNLATSRIINNYGGRFLNNSSFYCGDAGGRNVSWYMVGQYIYNTIYVCNYYKLNGTTNDFSCSDRKFALNYNVYYNPPEILTGNKENILRCDRYEYIHPNKINYDCFHFGMNEHWKWISTDFPRPIYDTTKPVVIISVGLPACGKSLYRKEVLEPLGFSVINQDTLKTKSKCLKQFKNLLDQKTNIVVDNTNLSKDVRKEYIDLTKACNKDYKIYCYIFGQDPDKDLDFEFMKKLSNHNINVRYLVFDVPKIPQIALKAMHKKFEIPSLDEGFDQIQKIKFTLKDIEDQDLNRKYQQIFHMMF